MHISCDDCSGRLAAACGDCLVTHLTSPADRDGPGPSVVVDLATQRAIRLLVEAGMVEPAGRREAG